MDRKKLDRIWREINAAYRSPQTAQDLEVLARLCGRTVSSGGNHPMWKSAFPKHRAVPIARHGGNPTISPRIRKIVLEHLEDDAAAWEELLAAEQGATNGDGDA